MGIWYEGMMSYYTPIEHKGAAIVGSAMIRSFSVDEGASRTINLKSTTDMSISSELEQARQFKNITLFMRPSKGHSDMKTALDLADAAVKKTMLSFSFDIQKVSGQTLLEALNLIDDHVTINKPPTIGADNLLKIEIKLTKARITYENRAAGLDRVDI